MTTPDADTRAIEPAVDPDFARPDIALGALVVPLLKGPLYRDADARRWQSLLSLQARVREHVAVLGLELHLDEAEGYAFLRSHTYAENEDEAEAIPRLMARRPLSFPVSLLLVLIRKRLVEFDATGGGTRLILTRTELVDLIRLFLPDGSNEARMVDQVDTHLNKVVDLGFLRRLRVPRGQAGGEREPRYEVMRILRAFVDAEWLDDVDARLTGYAALARGDAPDDESRDGGEDVPAADRETAS